jgi:nicotinamide riboside kinase
MKLIKKIVILGPESTGKSTLSEQLALRYETAWVPEYARTYLLDHGMGYSYPDLLTIAKGQLALEDKYLDELKREAISPNSPFTIHHLPTGQAGSPLFIDTNMYVMKVWCEFVFGRCHDWILQQIAEREYDLYLLCNIDLPWVHDPLREYPDLEPRQKLFHIYRDIMINQPVPWVEICGSYQQRLEKAIVAVDDLLAAR